MTKSELADALSNELKLHTKTTQHIIDTILDTITEKLVAGESVEIRGFGSFTVRQYDSYIGWKPKTDEQIEVKPKKLPFFRVGKALKEAVGAGKKITAQHHFVRPFYRKMFVITTVYGYCLLVLVVAMLFV